MKLCKSWNLIEGSLIAVDGKNDIIIEYDVSMNPSDQHQLSSMVKKVTRKLRLKKFTVLADKGYYNGADLLKLKRLISNRKIRPNSFTIERLERQRRIIMSEKSEIGAAANEPFVYGSIMVKLNPAKLVNVSVELWYAVLNKVSATTDWAVADNGYDNLYDTDNSVALFFDSNYPKTDAATVIGILRDNIFLDNNLYESVEVWICFKDTHDPDEYEVVFKAEQ